MPTRTQQRMFWTDTIQPLAINIADILTLKLCPPGTKIAIDSSKIGALNESLERKLDLAEASWLSGIPGSQ